MEETNRQRKIAGVLQKDLVDVLQKAAQDGMQGVIISVSKVSVTPDLGIAKVYLSVFPSDKKDETLKLLKQNHSSVKRELGLKVGKQMRKVPELQYYIDDSLDYYETIDNLLKK